MRIQTKHGVFVLPAGDKESAWAELYCALQHMQEARELGVGTLVIRFKSELAHNFFANLCYANEKYIQDWLVQGSTLSVRVKLTDNMSMLYRGEGISPQ